jgi:phospholipase/carboxylesterase
MKLLIAITLILTNMNSVDKSSYLKGEQMLLQYLVREPKTKLTKKPPMLLLLHGVGSNENDLMSFSENLPPEFLIISARAPFPLGGQSFAWYEVDFSTGKPVFNTEQAEKSRTIIIQFINQLKEKHNFDDQQVYLAGFSQGGIMAYSVGLTRPDKIKGIAVLSGRLLEEVKPKIASKEKLKELKILISHGKADEMLGFHYANSATQYLNSIGLKPELKEYNVGHTITPEILSGLNSWLNASTGNKISIN